MSAAGVNNHEEKNMLKDLMGLARELDNDELQELTEGVGEMMHSGCKPSEIGYFFGVVYSGLKKGYTVGRALELAFTDHSGAQAKPQLCH